MSTVHFIAILLHILAAVVWVGGMAFLGIVLIPALRQSALGDQALEVIRRTGVRFRTVGWACFAILILSGAVNLTRWGIDWGRFTSASFWSSSWGQALAAKLALVVLAIALSALHDFVIGPRASAELRRQPGSEAAKQLRRRASWMGRANLLIAVTIVALGIVLVRGLPS